MTAIRLNPKSLTPQPSNTVDLWSFSLERSDIESVLGYETLSVDEQAQAGRFQFEPHRSRFIRRRLVRRRILSHYLGISPREIHFVTGPHGKPSLVEAPGLIRFNSSHSGGLGLLAIASGLEVGVDLERQGLWDDHLSAVAKEFSTVEQVVLEGLSRESRAGTFYSIWSRKEAVLKATGHGLKVPLGSFTVAETVETSSGKVTIPVPDGREQQVRWWARTDWPDYSAAVAVVDVDDVDVRCIEFTPTNDPAGDGLFIDR